MSILIIICINSDGFNTMLNSKVYPRNEKLREVDPWVEGRPSISLCAESEVVGPLRSQFMCLSDVELEAILCNNVAMYSYNQHSLAICSVADIGLCLGRP